MIAVVSMYDSNNMKLSMKKNLTHIKTSALALILALSIGVVSAQAVPGTWDPVLGSGGSHTNDAPVTQNIPVNPISQAKSGGLGVTQMFVNGDSAFLGDVHIGYTYWSQAQNQSSGTGNAASFLLGKTALAQGSGMIPTLYPSDLYIQNLQAPINSNAPLCVDTAGQVKSCPVVVGVCGSGSGYRNGGSYYNDSSAATPQWAATTDAYCQTGTQSTLALSGSTWTWSCDGQFGGASVSCSATQLVVAHGSVAYTIPGSHSFTVPPGVSSVVVEVWGAGGQGGYGGGDAYNEYKGTGGAGGGGGGYTKKTVAVSPGATVQVVVGAGGANMVSANPQSGGVSSAHVGSTVLTASGGSAGSNGGSAQYTYGLNGVSGALGGSASGGTTAATGCSGGKGTYSDPETDWIGAWVGASYAPGGGGGATGPSCSGAGDGLKGVGGIGSTGNLGSGSAGGDRTTPAPSSGGQSAGGGGGRGVECTHPVVGSPSCSSASYGGPGGNGEVLITY